MDNANPLGNGSTQLPPPTPRASTNTGILNAPLNAETCKRFFSFTGGSLFYCLSAAFVAYGIVNVMGPLLSGPSALKHALPCIFTLHAYELALLGALLLIASRRVVDDAVSVVMLIALFLVGTSIALGSVADTGIASTIWLGVIGVVIGCGKFYAMRRFSRIPFRAAAFLGLAILLACNYLGPALLARSVAVTPLDQPGRRGLWLLLWLTILIGAALALMEAMRTRPSYRQEDTGHKPFLQSAPMVYLFVLVIFVASGVHQYAMAYASGLERVLGDYVPFSAVAAFLLVEILRHSEKRVGYIEISILCVPLAVMLLAIYQKAVLASGGFRLELLWYPPVTLGLCGLASAALAMYRRLPAFFAPATLYGLGFILTTGFSPERPHDLHMHACAATLIAGLVLYGLVQRRPWFCFAGLIVLCAGLSWSPDFARFVSAWHLTTAGGIAGVLGLGSVTVCLVFAGLVRRAVRILCVLVLAAAVLDFLPEHVHVSYLIALVTAMLISTGLWLRLRDIVAISILWIPYLIRLYVLTKRFAAWRFVVFGFLLLGVGIGVSLLKRRIADLLTVDKGFRQPPAT